MVCTWQELRSYLLGLGWYEVANTDGDRHYKMRHDDQPGRVVIMVRGQERYENWHFRECVPTGRLEHAGG